MSIVTHVLNPINSNFWDISQSSTPGKECQKCFWQAGRTPAEHEGPLLRDGRHGGSGGDALGDAVEVVRVPLHGAVVVRGPHRHRAHAEGPVAVADLVRRLPVLLQGPAANTSALRTAGHSAAPQVHDRRCLKTGVRLSCMGRPRRGSSRPACTLRVRLSTEVQEWSAGVGDTVGSLAPWQVGSPQRLNPALTHSLPAPAVPQHCWIDQCC